MIIGLIAAWLDEPGEHVLETAGVIGIISTIMLLQMFFAEREKNHEYHGVDGQTFGSI